MLIECWQEKVRDIRVDVKPTSWPLGGFMVDSRVLKVTRDREQVDAFEAYYHAAREKIEPPHYAFANLKTETDILPLFRQCGFPYYEGDQLMVSEVLIEAKRLRLLMETWSMVRADSWPEVKRLIGELRFALGWQAHWFYWPAPLHPAPDKKTEEAWEKYRDMAKTSLASERERELARAADLTDPNQMLIQMHGLLHEVCAEPLKSAELTPSVQLPTSVRVGQSQATLRWDLRPVHYLGEVEHEYGTYSVEKPVLRAPYGLMFLLDLTEGKETKVCAECRNVFVANRSDRIFCSYLCAHRVAVRRSRSRRNKRRKQPRSRREFNRTK
jgi:hypothetical protein